MYKNLIDKVKNILSDSPLPYKECFNAVLFLIKFRNNKAISFFFGTKFGKNS